MSDKPITIDIVGNIAPFQATVLQSDQSLDDVTSRAVKTREHIIDLGKGMHVTLDEIMGKARYVKMTIEETEREAKRRIDIIARQDAAILRRVRATERKALGVLRGVISLSRTVVSAFGISINPVFDSIVTMIETSLTSILAIHRAMEAGTLGASVAITATLSSVAIITSMASIGLAISGKADAQGQIRQATSALQQAESLISSVWSG